MAGTTKLMTAGGGGVNLTPASSIASDVTVQIPSQNCTLGIQGPAFSAYLSSAQSVTASTFTKVTLDTELFDTNNNFASSRFTPTVAGYYQLTGSMGIGAGVPASAIVVAISKNGSTIANNIQQITFNGTSTGSVSALVYMNGSTDYVELYAQINTVGSPQFAGSANSTYFQGSLVRAA